MHVHFFEPRADGHRMQYVRRLVEAAPRDWQLSLSTFPGALSHPGTQAAVAAGGTRLHTVAIAGEVAFEERVRGADGFALQPAYWRLMRRHWRGLAAAARGDLVVVPYLDYASYAIGAFGSPFGSTPFAGIVMRPDFHWAAQGVVAPASRHGGLKRLLFARLLRQRRLQRLVTIDPSLRDWAARVRPAGHERLCYADDPADLCGQGGRAEARRHFGLEPGATVLLLFGSIDLRKGVRALIELACRPDLPAEVQVLMAGRQSDEVRALLAEAAPRLPAGRLVQVDRYVDRQEEWLAFAAADFGWVAYEGFYGPSGVLAQCQQAGLPMIHRGEGLIGYRLAGAEALALPWLQSSGLQAARLPADAPGAPGIEQVMAT